MNIRISNAVKHMPYLIHLVPTNKAAFTGPKRTAILMIPNGASLDVSPEQVKHLEADVRYLNAPRMHARLGPMRFADLFVVEDNGSVSAIEAPELFDFIEQGLIA